MQPVLMYSVKKLLVMEENMTWGNIWKKLRVVECRYSPPEECSFSLYTQGNYLDFGFYLVSCFQEACFKFPFENTVFWAVCQAWACSDCYGTMTITEQSNFFVVAHYFFCNAKFLAMIGKLLYSRSRCLHFFLGLAIILSVILNTISCLKLE